MKLQENDWSLPGGVGRAEVEYPDAPIAEFLNWLRLSAAWRDNPEMVEVRLRRLNGTLGDYLNDRNLARDKAAREASPALVGAASVPDANEEV